MVTSEVKSLYGLLAVFSIGAALYAAFIYSLAPELVTDAIPGIEYKLTMAELRTLKDEARSQIYSATAPLVVSMIAWVLIGAWWLVRTPFNDGKSRESKGAI